MTSGTANSKLQVFYATCESLADVVGKAGQTHALPPLEQGKMKRLATGIVNASFNMADYAKATPEELQKIQAIKAKIHSTTNSLQKKPFFLRNPLFAVLDATCTRLDTISHEVENEILHREKASVFAKLAQRTNYDEVIQLFETRPALFTDREFLFTVVEKLAKQAPEQLCQELATLPISDRREALFLGARLADPNHRILWTTQFGLRFHFTSGELEAERTKYMKEKAQLNKELGSGICLGLSVTVMGSQRPADTSELLRKGRFVHMGKNLGFALPRKDPRTLGETILNNPEKYPFIILKSSMLLREFNGQQKLLEAYRGNRKLEIATIVGRLAQKLPLQITEKEAELLEWQTKKTDLTGRIGSSPELALQHRDELKECDKQIQTLTFEIFIAKKDVENLARALETTPALPGAFIGRIPERIMKKHNIETGQPIYSRIPIAQLSEKIVEFQDKEGSFLLNFSSNRRKSNGGLGGHAITFSFRPCMFFDMNDIDPATNRPRIREFTNTNEMLAAFRSYLAKYNNQIYTSFSIIPLKRLDAPASPPVSPVASREAPSQPASPSRTATTQVARRTVRTLARAPARTQTRSRTTPLVRTSTGKTASATARTGGLITANRTAPSVLKVPPVQVKAQARRASAIATPKKPAVRTHQRTLTAAASTLRSPQKLTG